MMVMRALLIACAAIAQLMVSNAYYHTRYSRSNTYLAKLRLASQQKATVTSATGISETEKNVVSKEKEINSGLFRKISLSNKVFEFDEILSSEDVDEYQKRFHNLMVLFPDVSETDLRTLVFISPLLLALETSSLQTAVNRLHDELPFVDPSYVVSQRSCGLDLLLSCMSPMFDLETRRNDVIQVIGKERNITEFLRRVPHCLTPRYLVALRDHCLVMKEVLQLDAKSSLNVVERWPGILGIDLVQSLSRFNSSMHRLELVPLQEAGTLYLTKILRAVPRALMQDMPRRAHLLRQNFPLWDLPTIIQKYPRILTQKIQGLKSNYEILEGILDPLEISADNFVNIFPRSLGYNPHQLLATAHSIAAVLPGLSVHDIYKRVPRILSLRPKEVLLPQIRRLQKSFSKSFPVDSREKKKSGQSGTRGGGRETVSNIEDIDLELGQIDRADYGDDDEIFMADLYGAEGSAESKGRQKVVHLLAQINSKETHFANRPFKTDSTAQTESADQYKHDLKISLTSDDLSETQTSPAPTLVTQPSASDFDTAESRIDSGTQKSLHAGGKRSRSTDVTTADDDDTINVTRIIIGNLDAFIDRYPYFIDKVNGWTKDFGPSLAYAVLTAVPAVLTKKTTTLRPILKHLYSLIVDSGHVKMNEINTATGNKGSTSDSKDGADATSVNTLLYSALNVLLLEAPSILRKKPADVDLRIKQLADLLEHCGNSKHCVVAVGQVSATPSVEDISSYASKAKLLAVRVPRLLVESKVERIAFRSQLLLYYQGHSLDRTQEQHSQTPVIKIKSKKNLLKKAATTPNDAAAERTFFESVLSKCPEILAGPSSTLARLFFAASYLRKPNTNLPVTAKSTRAAIPLTVDHVEELLNCNTKNFLLSLSELGDEESETLDRAYGKYLRALIEDLTPPSPGQLSHSVPAPSSEASTGDKGTVEVKEDLNFDDADDNANQTCLGSSGSLLSVDLGSSELERILCGVFNDLTAAAGITSDITVSAPTSSLNANIVNASLNGSKEVLSMTAEVQRLERTCEKVGSVLMKLAT